MDYISQDYADKMRVFAHRKHNEINHRRKYVDEPYTVHLDEVAEIIRGIKGSEFMVAVAYGHDLLEDTQTTVRELVTLFPVEIVAGIVELTDVFTSEDYPNLNRAERKDLEAKRLGGISAESKTVKLADMLSNSSDILKNDPNFAKTYLKEKAFLLPFLKTGNAELFKRNLDFLVQNNFITPLDE